MTDTPTETLEERVARKMLADELVFTQSPRDFDTVWENEKETWLLNARSAITAMEASRPPSGLVEADTLERLEFALKDAGDRPCAEVFTGDLATALAALSQATPVGEDALVRPERLDEAIRVAMRAVLDPGQFTPDRHGSDFPSLPEWQREALRIAFSRRKIANVDEHLATLSPTMETDR